MELQTKALDIMFRRLSPEQLLRLLMNGDNWPDEKYYYDEKSYFNLFLTYAESTLGGYSVNEQEYILRYFGACDGKAVMLPFVALSKAADQFLVPGVNGPQCRFEEAIHWREAYLLLGQDLFTCAWLAQKPERRFLRKDFSWPVVISTDNRILNKISEGAAENHMHLYAGASVYALSWISLMNHPDTDACKEIMLTDLQMHGIRGEAGNLWPLRRKMLYAAFLRTRLFRKTFGDRKSLLCSLKEFHRDYTNEDIVSAELKEEIDSLRHMYGRRFQQPGFTEPACLDYAFTCELSREKESDYRLLAGERLLLYSCFQKLYRGELSQSDQLVVYLYLLLKAQIRSELVQVNQQVGFANFSDYDSRKKLLWKQYPEYFNEDIRQAVTAPIREQHLSSLEGRICPQMSVAENLDSVYKIDRSALFSSANAEERDHLRNWETCSCMENLAEDQKYFFVLHFPKEPDNAIGKDMQEMLCCRHDQYRQRLRLCGIELAKTLVNCKYFCERIRGIDACSQEIGCRPEVFATLFRFLRSFRPEAYDNEMLPICSPSLSLTYHVGEDYLDIADGLRAMDEAIRFLGFRHGDRFGHAIALGVDPTQHYACKHRQSILTKQDLLDNLVWIYYRSSELQVEIPELLRNRIRAKMHALFDHIYGKGDLQNRYTLRNYYDSMFLRGDDPRCYRNGVYQPIDILDQFDLFCENSFNDELHSLAECRKTKAVVELYYLYHYDLDAKRKGSESEIWDVDTDYIALMRRLQQAMREYISRSGISIECNPSSNVLIGTFRSYQEHPILAFNTMGLTNNGCGTQMHISINSDDPGVFDTTVSFEYALLACALREKKDENGRPIYSERQIEDYLRNIVRMGIEQIFPPCDSLAIRKGKNSRFGALRL